MFRTVIKPETGQVFSFRKRLKKQKKLHIKQPDPPGAENCGGSTSSSVPRVRAGPQGRGPGIGAVPPRGSPAPPVPALFSLLAGSRVPPCVSPRAAPRPPPLRTRFENSVGEEKKKKRKEG